MPGKNIRVSEKHGVNPSLGVCFWCGQEDGSVLMLGKLPGDKEAPRRTINGYEPCGECKKGMERGITFIQMSKVPLLDEQSTVGEGYPTGRWVVVKEDAVKTIVQPPELLESLLKTRKAFVWVEDWKQMGLPTE